MTLSVATKNDDVDEAVNLLNEHGFVILPHLIDQDTVAEMQCEARPLFDRAPSTTRDGHASATKVIKGIAVSMPSYPKLILHRMVKAISDRILLPNCEDQRPLEGDSTYTLSGTNAFEVGPGASYQFLHRDDHTYPLPRPHAELIVNFMLAIDDFTEENGATRIIPGSHRWTDSRVPRQEDAISAVMPSGSVLVFLGSVIHGAGQNSTKDRYRMSVNGACLVGWLRQCECQYLIAPLEVARKLPRPLAELLGYKTYGGYLGMVNVEQDLSDLLDSEDNAIGVAPRYAIKDSH